MLTHLPPLASYTPVYGNVSSVDSGNLNILSSLPGETRLCSLEHKQVMPKVQGLRRRKHSTHTHPTFSAGTLPWSLCHILHERLGRLHRRCRSLQVQQVLLSAHPSPLPCFFEVESYYVAQIGLDLQMLGLQACTTMHSLLGHYWKWSARKIWWYN